MEFGWYSTGPCADEGLWYVRFTFLIYHARIDDVEAPFFDPNIHYFFIAMFMKDGRPGSRRQLIVFITGEDETVTDDVRSAAKKLEKEDVKVIYVKMGDVDNYSDPPSKNVITDRGTDHPDKLAEFVSEKSDKSKYISWMQ